MKKLAVTVLLCLIQLLCRAQDNVDDALAYQYYQQGQFQQAAVLLEKLFNNTKSDAYFELYFNSLLKLKKFDEAEKLARKQIRQNPKSLQYGIALARIYQDKVQTEAANKM